MMAGTTGTNPPHQYGLGGGGGGPAPPPPPPPPDLAQIWGKGGLEPATVTPYEYPSPIAYPFNKSRGCAFPQPPPPKALPRGRRVPRSRAPRPRGTRHRGGVQRWRLSPTARSSGRDNHDCRRAGALFCAVLRVSDRAQASVFCLNKKITGSVFFLFVEISRKL